MGDSGKLVLEVEGMTCGHCVKAVAGALRAVAGVTSAEVTLDPPRAVIVFDPAKTGSGALIAATAGEGYPSRVVA